MRTYFARICWNTNDWRFPMRKAPKVELGSFVAKYGFGFEEWLQSYSWMLGDYHYSFLQPVGHPNRQGQDLHVLLYTIDDKKQRLYVGEIRQCHVIEEADAAKALREYESRGWLREMRSQVTTIGGDETRITKNANPLDIFNIRFRPEDLVYYEQPLVAGPDDRVRRLNRYRLAEIRAEVLKKWKRRSGSFEPPGAHPVDRRGTGPSRI
ncbi:MAG: hypothetical protein QM757_03840 [Paludibaculum sp.]